jgi:hypothetical protein
MGLDFSQKRLLAVAMKGGKNKKRNERLQLYAFFTGLMSTLISLVHLVITALK